jgi:hypothetical protein
MKMYRGFALMVAALLTAIAPVLAQPSPEDQRTAEQVRNALLRLPYYGVFDFLAFRYEKGVVTLSGYAYRLQLKNDAVGAVRRLPRVDEVIDKIEELPTSQFDDSLRWKTFYTIYDDPILSRYAPGAAVFGIDRRFEMSRFPGMQPVGMYPIHVIVNRGRILLVGAVDSAADKSLVGIRTNGIPGAFGVENALEVVNQKAGTR